MVDLIRKKPLRPSDIINDIQMGKIHVVCMAQNGLTHLNVYVELYCKLPKDTVNQCVDLVNTHRETGTFFPKAYITILPKSENKSEWNMGAPELTMAELQNCIKDVFKANKEYLKSEIIYFSLEGSYINTNLTYSIISDLVTNGLIDDPALKEIWFSS